MRKERYAILPSFSLQPNKLVGYNSIFKRDYENERLVPIQERSKVIRINKSVSNNQDNLLKKRKELKLSDNAYRTLKKKINWLYYLSKSRYVKTYNGKEIYNFKINFITLTLPSKQRTPTIEVNKNLMNNFLTEVRQRTDMQNYVWRLEFQKNGNVHYHIVTDTYLDYFFILKIWNRILKLNNYIEDYHNKHKDLSLVEYNKIYNPDKKIEFNVIAKRYAKGKSNKWEQPNSVDVKSVISKKAISNYISKYFSKSNNDNPIMNEYDNEDNIESLRIWFCSRSLSKLNTVSNFCEAVEYDLFAMLDGVKSIKKVFHKYAMIVYFDIKSLFGDVRKFIEILLKDYSKRQGYIPSS